ALEALRAGGKGPVAVLDPADNPMSGGIGDTPALLAALLAARMSCRAVFAFLFDPLLVAQAHEAGIGATLDCRLGGRLTDRFGPPVAATARVARLTNGRFTNRGPMERGLPVDLGRTCVLEIGGDAGVGAGEIKIIVTETCQSPNDPEYFRLH